jgi:hypothetical protein
LVCLVILLALVTALSAPVLAKDYSGTETIARDSYFSKSISVKTTFLGAIDYTVTVTNGPAVDVYLLDKTNFDKYVADQSFDPAEDDLNVTSATEMFYYTSDATYYLVVDNTDRGTHMPTNPPVPAATVTWTLSAPLDEPTTDALGWFGFAFGLCIAVAVIMVVIRILILIWVYKDAEKRGTSGVMWLIIVFLLGIIGLIIYLIVRPKVPVGPPPGYAPPPPGYAPPPPGYAPPPPGYAPPPPGYAPPPQQPPQAPPQQ